MPRLSLAAVGFVLLLSSRSVQAGPAAIDFNRDIRPILADNCFACHGPDEKQRKAGLRLDTREGALGQRDGGPVLVPGKSGQSELLRRLLAEDQERMPPRKSNRKLTNQQIELVRRWIDQGATWSDHWALVPPQRPDLPAVSVASWPRNAIDRFILARLDREGLKPAPEARREPLLRRVSLDLTGLPPSLRELDETLADQSPDWYEKVVDRLLASPRYGERMALEWLDAARYADSNGYQTDATRTMWPWRDWLIRSLNRNVPFDRLTIEMIAGDLLPGAAAEQKIASGFHRNHMLNGEGGRIAEESRIDYVVDRVDTTATVWLGLTLGCARCHDHKFDPFSQRDYYQLFAYFNNIAETGSVDRGGNAAPVLPLPTPEQTAKQKELSEKSAELEKQLKASADQNPASLVERSELQKKLDETRKALEALNKSIVQVMVMEERPQPRETRILIRGAYDRPGGKVSPGVPARLATLPKDAPPNRLGLARWLVSPDNPLTARVTVNRAWQMFFGTALVKTTEDFGVQGEAPSHPELLDWLATEFVGQAFQPDTSKSQAGKPDLLKSQAGKPDLPKSQAGKPDLRSGWDLKHLHRLLVTSAAYRQSSRIAPELMERDPANRLLARGPRGRLSSLVIRDQALFVSGLLVEKVGGPPVRPYQPPGVWEEMTFGKIQYKQDKGESLYRRSLYTFWRRTVGPTNLFDTSARQVCTVRQGRTNTPLHALVLLNDITYVEASRVLAQRLLSEGKSADERIVTLFRLATARRPTADEQALLRRSLERFRKQYQADPEGARKLVSVGEAPGDSKIDVIELAAYTGLASVVLNLDEVISKE